MILTYIRLLTYLTEYQFLRLTAKIMGWPMDPLPKFTKQQKMILNNAVKSLLNRWKKVIKSFPASYEISNPVIHLTRYWLILKDLRLFLERKNRKDSHDLKNIYFDDDCPEYFKRNYHYQTDGYFTKEGAARYDHQIELLFLGTGHIMRKVAYSSIASVLKDNASVLEFGAASGTSGHQFKLLYPGTKLDILEPGKEFLSYARTNYPGDFNKVITGFMENFRSEHKYDCIFSCFVMHEIPVKYWDDVCLAIKEALKDDGYLLIIDAQQNSDREEHQFALDQFAEDFYEPFFEEYRAKPLEDYFREKGFELLDKNEVLFSKTLLFSKTVVRKS